MAIYSKLEFIEPQLWKVIDNVEVSDEIGLNEGLGIQYCHENYSNSCYWILNNNDNIIDPNYNIKHYHGQIGGYWLQKFNTFTPQFDSADVTISGYNLYKVNEIFAIDSTNYLSFNPEL